MAKNTLAAYARDLARYEVFLSDAGVSDAKQITKTQVSAFAEQLVTKYALKATSVARVLSGVRGLHKFWLMEQVTEGDVAAAIKPPTAPKRLPKAISLHDV